jgi:PPOX class probable F420-dependent enzyme
MVFDGGTAADARALERLRTDMIGWLTTVTPDGQPQTFPVWFLWEGGEVLVYGKHRAQRNANIAANPRVSIHLADDGDGGDLVIIEGIARVDPATPPPNRHPGYMAKYADWMVRDLGSVAKMASDFDVPIRIAPVRGVASGA